MADQSPSEYPEGTRFAILPGETTPHVFLPTDGKPATDDQISAALKAIPSSSAPNAPKARTWTDTAPSDSSALVLQGARKALPAATDAVMNFATSPTAAKNTSTVVKNAVTAGGVLKGVMTASPAQVLAAPTEGWAAGKGAYWLARGAQGLAAPIGAAMDAARPYLPAVNTLAGVQGGLDLAQMAEPNRKDIGFLGIGPSDHTSDDRAAVMGAQIKALVTQGMSPREAARTVSNAWAKFLSEQRK